MEGICMNDYPKVTIPADWSPTTCDLCGHALAAHDSSFACVLCECDGVPKERDRNDPPGPH